jgi:hypothetical protein
MTVMIRSIGVWIIAASAAACVQSAAPPSAGGDARWAGLTDHVVDRHGDGWSVTALHGEDVVGVVTWRRQGDAVTVRAEPEAGPVCELAVDRRTGTVAGRRGCAGAVATVADALGDPAVRAELGAVAQPEAIAAGDVAYEDADRCGGKTINTVCSECVGSGFSDIWTCGACAYCLGF